MRLADTHTHTHTHTQGWQGLFGSAGVCALVVDMVRRWPDDYATQLAGRPVCVCLCACVCGASASVSLPPGSPSPPPQSPPTPPAPPLSRATPPPHPGLYEINALLGKHQPNHRRLFEAGAATVLVRTYPAPLKPPHTCSRTHVQIPGLFSSCPVVCGPGRTQTPRRLCRHACL
jgi:hypothetical protein